jgi:hypothetical protein
VPVLSGCSILGRTGTGPITNGAGTMSNTTAGQLSTLCPDPQTWQDAYHACLSLTDFIGWTLDAAGHVLGDSVDPAYLIPTEERDDTSAGITYSPLDVLSALAAVWITCRQPRARALAVTVACEELKRRRAQQSAAPIRIGHFIGASAAEAIWKAGTFLAGSPTGLGCARLAEIIQGVYPDSIRDDPWLIGSVLDWWSNPSVDDPETLADAMLREAERQQRKLGHLSQLIYRFRGHNLRDAIASVRIEALCRWLRDAFPEFDSRWLRKELELEFDLIPSNTRGDNSTDTKLGKEEPQAVVDIEQHMQRVAEAVGDENAVRILAIANRSDLSGERKMEELIRLDSRFASKDSVEWGKLIGVSPAAIRGYGLWKRWQEAKKRDL